MTEDVRAVAERRLAEEEAAARDARITELAEQEERRREAQARERAAAEKRSAALEEAREISGERQESALGVEAAAGDLVRAIAELESVDARFWQKVEAAGFGGSRDHLPTTIAGFLAGVIGDRVGRVDSWRDRGRPPLRERLRDPLRS